MISRLSKVNLVVLCTMILLAVLLWLTDYLTSVVLLMAGALLLTYLLIGPVHVIETILAGAVRRMAPALRRTVSILVVYLLGFVLAAVFVLGVVPDVVDQLRDFAAHEVPNYLQKIETGSPTAAAETPRTFFELLDGIWSSGGNGEGPRLRGAALSEATSALMLKKLVAVLQEYASRIGAYVLNLGTMTVTGVVYFLTALVMVFYMLHDGRVLKDGFVAMMPNRTESGVGAFLERLHEQFYNYLRAQVVSSSLWGALMFLLLVLLKVKYALLLALVFGVLSIIPVIGPWCGLIPIGIVTALSEYPGHFLSVLGFNGIFYMVKVYWLWPRLIQRHYDIHPVMFIVTFLVCLQAIGYGGILLSFPVASVLGASFDYLRTRNNPA